MEPDTIKIRLFKNSRDSFIQMLDKKPIPYQMLTPPVGVPMAASLEVAIALTSLIIKVLAGVIVAWLETKKSREVIIQSGEYKIVHIRGYSQKDVEKLIATAVSVSIIDPGETK